MSITVYIERLVLDGAVMAAHDPQRVGGAIQAALERLLAADGLGPEVTAGGARTRLFTRDIHIASGAGANELGAQVGQAVYGALHPAEGVRARMTRPPAT